MGRFSVGEGREGISGRGHSVGERAVVWEGGRGGWAAGRFPQRDGGRKGRQEPFRDGLKKDVELAFFL